MQEVYVHSWENVENSRGLVQIFHGMAEHAARYGEFAAFLNQSDYIVFADDHRGHGKTAGCVEELGRIGKDGFNRIVEDKRELSLKIRGKYPGLPLFILGHSFGSFIAQEYITRYGGEIDGLVLSGTAVMDGPEVSAGKAIAWLQKAFLGENAKSRLINKMSFGTYNSRVENPASPFAWLTRDEKIVRKYEDDPYCGTVFTTGFYYYFFKGLEQLYRLEKLARIPKTLPISIVVGAEDPLSLYGKNAVRLRDKYADLGIRDLSIKLYPGGRHEILNETNRREVYADVLDWLAGHSGTRL